MILPGMTVSPFESAFRPQAEEGAPVRRANQIITVVLAVVAVLGWVRYFLLGSPFDPRSMNLLLGSVTACACIGWIMLTLTRPRDKETRCRKCQYILRGLPEPRCPECGERI